MSCHPSQASPASAGHARFLIAPRAVTLGLLLAVVASPAIGQWAPGGIQVPGGDAALICRDGSGGIYAGLEAASYDVFAFRLLPTGLPPVGFPPGALPVCTTPDIQELTGIVPDGQGGAIVHWLDNRIGTYYYQSLFAQRVTGDGQISPGWTVDGVPVSGTPAQSYDPQVIPDGSGGAYFAWGDERNGQIEDYVQHLLADGQVAAGWPTSGMPMVVAPYRPSGPLAISDGAGGLLVFFGGLVTVYDSIYALRLTPAGTPSPGWPLPGKLIATGSYLGGSVPDGSGGAFLGLRIISRRYRGADSIYVMLRIDASGNAAAGWPAGGITFCSAANYRSGLVITPDGMGGVLATWGDFRPPGPRAYAMRINPNGSFPPGWLLNGMPASTLPGITYPTDVVADGLGGAYVSYTYEIGSNFSYIQHLQANGTPWPGWYGDGFMLNPEAGQSDPVLASDDAGGAYVVWNNYGHGIYAQRYLMDGVVATELALVSADAQSDQVSLLWQGAVAASVEAAVERRTMSSGWERIGTPILEGQDRLRYEDRDIVPGSRYGYRLTYRQGAVTELTDESWVDVPTASRLALEGLRPNPAVGPLAVSFALPSAAPASLEVLDVSGRRRMQRDVGALGAGTHVVRFDEGATLEPGVYWIRLRQDDRTLIARGAVVR